MIGQSGTSQLVRRAVVAFCFCAALVGMGALPRWAVVILVVGGLAIYAFWPSTRFEPEAHTMDQVSAVTGPDIIGFGLLAFFVALPVWIGKAEGADGLHGSALLIWVMLPGPLIILGVGAANACFSVSLDAEGLSVSRMWRTTRLRWDEIAGWRRWRRGLPRFLRLLVPFLPPTPAGAVLLARDSTGIELQLGGGGRLRLPREGFEHGEARVLRALVEHGVPCLAAGCDHEGKDG